jgi:hypothetical protein
MWTDRQTDRQTDGHDKANRRISRLVRTAESLKEVPGGCTKSYESPNWETESEAVFCCMQLLRSINRYALANQTIMTAATGTSLVLRKGASSPCRPDVRIKQFRSDSHLLRTVCRLGNARESDGGRIPWPSASTSDTCLDFFVSPYQHQRLLDLT